MSVRVFSLESPFRSILPYHAELVVLDVKMGKKFELHLWHLNETGVEEGLRR